MRRDDAIGGEKDAGGMMSMMGMMPDMKGSGKGAGMPMMPKMMVEMMPKCLTMMLPQVPKEK